MRYLLKDLSIDIEARTVHRGDDTIRLPDLSFDVLIALIDAVPNPVSLSKLSKLVWQVDHVSDETIAQRVTLIRKALGDDPKAPTYIRTVRNKGYCIVGKVTRHDSVTLSTSHSDGLMAKRAVITLAACAALLISFGFAASVFQPQSLSVLQVTTDSEAMLLVKRARAQLSLHQDEETDRAIELLSRALESEPDLFDARLTLSFALSTKATKFRGDETEKFSAELLARGLIEDQPGNTNAWSALGYALSSQGRISEALAAYRQSIGLDPTNASALSSAAYLLLLKGELQQALILEMRAKNIGGASRYAEIQIAQILEIIDHPRAADWRMQALALNPGQAVVVSEVARSHLRRGDPQAALFSLEQYEGEDNSAPHILVLRARAYLALGQIEAAQQALENAGWRGQYGLAALHAKAGDASFADMFFFEDKQTDLGSEPDPEIRIQLAEIAAALGNEAVALEHVSEAVSLGWRDIRWLQYSPYLGKLMATEKGQMIETRIGQEVEAQRRLIDATEELHPILKARY